jgi:nicotinamide-nucleotide amidase
MPENINAEIIAIGTEILLGEITDTNSVYIARLLRDIGLNLYYMTSVGDNEKRISDTIRIALSRAQVVITCGGLGPTIDDMTRQGVANATSRELVFHQELLDKIAERFTTFRAQMTDNNRRQAFLPASAIVIENPVGTAPSYIVEHEGKIVISLPGVPREMKFLMTESVIPYLRERFKLGSGIIKARVLRTAGIGESLLDSQIGPELLEANNPTVGLAAHTGQVDIRITAKADSEPEADEMIAIVEAELRGKIGRFIFGVDQDQIEVILSKILSDRHALVAISETGIGNPISNLLKSAPSANEIIAGIENFETPDSLQRANAIETDLNIRELAERTASSICQRYNTSAGIAVVSDPSMGEFHADNESGTAIAVYLNGKNRSRVFGFGGQTDIAQNWVSTWSMSTLWQMLQE